MDVIVRFKNKKFRTRISSKRTDTHQYLNHKSCHPSHVKRGIPYGQALRLRQICETDKLFDKRLKGMTGDFIKWGNKEKFLDFLFEKEKEKEKSRDY